MDNTTENNKMIETFMTDRKVTPSGKLMGFKRGAPIQYENWYDTIEVSSLNYHKNWNKLMPVVNKIEDLGYSVGYTGRMTVINSPKSKKPFYRASHSNGMRMENLYEAVIEFIKWYNLNQNNQPL